MRLAKPTDKWPIFWLILKGVMRQSVLHLFLLVVLSLATLLAAAYEHIAVLMVFSIFNLCVSSCSIALIFSRSWLYIWQNLSHFWVVERRGSLIAYAVLVRHRTYAVIHQIGVAPTWRRQGIGSALLQALIQEATPAVYLLSFHEAIAFYTRLGFIQVALRQLPVEVRRNLSFLCGM